MAIRLSNRPRSIVERAQREVGIAGQPIALRQAHRRTGCAKRHLLAGAHRDLREPLTALLRLNELRPLRNPADSDPPRPWVGTDSILLNSGVCSCRNRRRGGSVGAELSCDPVSDMEVSSHDSGTERVRSEATAQGILARSVMGGHQRAGCLRGPSYRRPVSHPAGSAHPRRFTVDSQAKLSGRPTSASEPEPVRDDVRSANALRRTHHHAKLLRHRSRCIRCGEARRVASAGALREIAKATRSRPCLPSVLVIGGV